MRAVFPFSHCTALAVDIIDEAYFPSRGERESEGYGKSHADPSFFSYACDQNEDFIIVISGHLPHFPGLEPLEAAFWMTMP